MNKLSFMTLVLGAALSTSASADGADDLMERNRILSEMKFAAQKLGIQAEMARAFKDMKEAGVLVDPRGVPMGIGGDMEVLALQMLNRGGLQSNTGTTTSDPFWGASSMPRVPPGQSMFGDAGFTSSNPASVAPAKIGFNTDKVEVIGKSTEEAKGKGKQVLKLAELRGNSATLFTNDGFKELKVGQSVYGQKLTHIGADSITLEGKDGSRIVRIDWAKSVRYSDN